MAEQQKTMATDFWKSGHCRHFLLEQRVADASNPKDLNTGLTMQQLRLVKGYFVDALAGAVLHFAKDRETSLFSRQRTIATAAVYLWRFYLNQSFCDHDPCEIAAVCLSLAGATLPADPSFEPPRFQSTNL